MRMYKNRFKPTLKHIKGNKILEIGCGHIATAVRTPLISINMCSNYDEVRPIGENVVVLHNPDVDEVLREVRKWK